METITVVIIIIILIILGLVYAANQRKDTIGRDREQIQQTEAMKITTRTLGLDYLTCSILDATLETCIDYYKIQALRAHTTKEENYEHFYRLFANTQITIQIIKNMTNPNLANENITIYQAQQTENLSRTTIRVPTTVKDAIRDINYFAIMEVQIFT